MEKQDFITRKLALEKVAVLYNYSCIQSEVKTGKVSYKDETGMVRIDVYLTKNTVTVLTKGQQPKYLKNQTHQQIENIFKNPY